MTRPWPASREALLDEQERLAAARPALWRPVTGPCAVGGCWACFPRGFSGAGARGDPVWAAAAVLRDGRVTTSAVVTGCAGAPYVPGLLALREGPVLERAVRAPAEWPDVVLVNATGRDHPRGAGLALQLGALLDLPTIGVTDRPLVAEGAAPGPERGARADLRIGEEIVACRLRTRAGVRPLVVHPAWRTDLATAAAVVLGGLPALADPGAAPGRPPARPRGTGRRGYPLTTPSGRSWATRPASPARSTMPTTRSTSL